MKIGELARRTGLRHSRIRYYERIGLLRTVDRLPNGYRLYSDDAEMILGLIAMAQRAGFSLEEIQQLVPTDLSQWNHHLLAQMLASKITEIEMQETRLAAAKAQLLGLQAAMAQRPEDLDCAANAERLLALVLPALRGPGDPAADDG